MAVFVDEVIDYGGLVSGEARRYGTKWTHMTADSPEELHTMAAKLGLKREWCSDHTQPDSRLHYDLTPNKRALAVRYGALEIKIWTHESEAEQKKKARERARTLFD